MHSPFVGLLRIVLFVTLLLVFSCNEDREFHSKVDSTTEDIHSISIDELFLNREKHLNKKVIVLGFLFTHEEGPWLESKPGSTVKNILKLTVSEDFQLEDPEGRKIRWFEYSPEGRDVKISGVFSVEREKLSSLDGHFRDKPQVRVESVTIFLP